MERQHEILLKILAGNIKERRKVLGISQEQLAESAEISRNYIAGIETIKDSPSLGILVRIAGALGVSVSELLRGQDERTIYMAERISTMLSSLSEDDAGFLEKEITAWVSQLRKKC